ncbi:MAG: hypothetical protein AB7E80_14500 [Hyphomicrobiaceae bacterium]
MSTSIRSTLVAGAIVVASATVAASSPFTAATSAAVGPQQSLIEQVHYCHRDVRKGGAGWHRHAGPNCRRVAFDRGGPGNKRYWYRGPRCETYCVGIGPLRVCDRDCG